MTDGAENVSQSGTWAHRTHVCGSCDNASGVAVLIELQAREEEVAREWQWLQDALNTVARGHVGEDEVTAFRLLQHQAVAVGQRRVELQMEMARLEGRP